MRRSSTLFTSKSKYSNCPSKFYVPGVHTGTISPDSKKHLNCNKCKGTRIVEELSFGKCELCNGRGRVGLIVKDTVCSNCRGLGNVIDREFRQCTCCLESAYPP